MHFSMDMMDTPSSQGTLEYVNLWFNDDHGFARMKDSPRWMNTRSPKDSIQIFVKNRNTLCVQEDPETDEFSESI